jgi:hypothetical protein
VSIASEGQIGSWTAAFDETRLASWELSLLKEATVSIAWTAYTGQEAGESDPKETSEDSETVVHGLGTDLDKEDATAVAHTHKETGPLKETLELLEYLERIDEASPV